MTSVKPISPHCQPTTPEFHSSRVGKTFKNFSTLVLCYPLTHRIANKQSSGLSNKFFRVVVLFIQFFFSLIVSAIFLDGIINKTFNPSPQTSPLSVDIEILLFYLGSTLPDAIVDIIELLDRMDCSFKLQAHVSGGQRKLFLLVSKLFLCSAGFISCLISTVQLELDLVLRED